MNAQEALSLAMQENGVKTCSAKVQRYLQGNAKCTLEYVRTEKQKGYQVKVNRTGETEIFDTCKEACLFMAGKLAERRT